MIRALFLVLILSVVSACGNDEATNPPLNDSVAVSSYSKLQGLFTVLSIDTFVVESNWETEKENFPFKGQAMDSVQVSLLPYEIRNGYSWNQDFGACVKFPLDETRMALIARTPGEYVSSALKLFVFDLKKDSITKTLELADIFGDAGEIYISSSCLFRDKNKDLMVLTYHWGEYDHRAGQIENDTLVETWTDYYLCKLSGEKVDTLSKDSTEIVNQFPAVIRKLEKE